MNKRGSMMLRVLTNRFHPKNGNALLKFLSQDDADAVLEHQITSTDLKPILEQPQKALASIHYSWIQPLLQYFPNQLHQIVMSALTAEQISGIKSTHPTTISHPVKNFILNKLYYFLKIEDHLPIEYLTPTELTPLATWSKQQIVTLIDYLGLHDLASEVRHVVNRNHLQNIYKCLTAKQFYYLKKCLSQKEQLTSPKLGFDPANINCDQLRQSMHKRGLIRLSRALCGQHSDLTWHIAYKLDKGRGTILLKEFQTQPLPKITAILKQQVLNLMNFLKSG